MQGATAQRYQQALETLRRHGQEQLLGFYDQLSEEEASVLLEEIESQDWERLAGLIARYVTAEPAVELPESIEPTPYFSHRPAEADRDRYERARALGETLVRDGKVAAFTVAGGQGTRLGWDGPKGTFPASPIEGKPLFQLFAESLVRTGRKYGRTVPWYVMTSTANDRATREFFAEHDHFGFPAEDLFFFTQGMLPSIGLDGRVLLASPGRIALNPDGHGGSLRALHQSGALADMRRRGIEQISYFQVDNPLVRCVDPLFLGLHVDAGAQMSSKMVAKSSAEEKVGNFCMVDGRVTVIEYSDLPSELAQRRTDDGQLAFRAGSIAVHAIDVALVERLAAGSASLPFHRAVKKVPHVDAAGRPVRPDAPNAVKLETFVFDALPLCEQSIVYESLREEEFGPIKNAEGTDSAETSRVLQSRRALRWLASQGVAVDAGAEESAVIDLSPLTAIEPADLADRTGLPERIATDARLSL